MNLTERERTILQLGRQGLSDYRIARKINTDPPSVTRSRKNAHKKLLYAVINLEWASRIGISISEINSNMFNMSANFYNFFL
ncbi:LuxR C-terminal-related transcriptional regulator [Candidatus Bathyarchaeota archaeon]|nr:LuxR C-terminal-related transcriptional regulator [Candidatus Bathyarchaeota archaeon]